MLAPGATFSILFPLGANLLHPLPFLRFLSSEQFPSPGCDGLLGRGVRELRDAALGRVGGGGGRDEPFLQPGGPKGCSDRFANITFFGVVFLQATI